MIRHAFQIFLVFALTAVSAFAVVTLETTPYYQSSPLSHVATGGAWADTDGDGWLDMVVANGNDIYRQNLVVYRNDGTGNFPSTPSWSSGDIDYHGHLDMGDIDGDGFIDVAVAVYIGPAGFSQPGKVKVYSGAPGSGFFYINPTWESDIDFYCFSLALGDADGDGDLDLACAAGESYNIISDRQKIFYNIDGSLETTPSWESDELGYALDVAWEDVDLDGDLDLAVCGIDSPNRIYLNRQTEGGGIPTTADWTSTDPLNNGNTAAFGDWNDDGYLEFAVADNNQLGGYGKFKVYENNMGLMTTTPEWTSNSSGYGSHVSWVDIDLDFDPDLAAGRWWGAVRLYENTGGDLTGSPAWTSSTNSVIENCFWGDVDNDALVSGGTTIATGDGARTFVKLARNPVRSVDGVWVGGDILLPDGYCVHLEKGWVSFATPPSVGQIIEVRFTYSLDLDLGVTNWDSSIGNYVFRNTGSPTSAGDFAASSMLLDASPNPFRGSTVFSYRGPESANSRLEIFDVRGRRVRDLHTGSVSSLQSWEWNGRDDRGQALAGGIYLAKFRSGGESKTAKIVKIR
jgi:hypothetical protein